MRVFIKNSYLFLFFFILVLSKDFLFGLLKKDKDIDLSSEYINSLKEKEDNINKIINISYNANYIYGKVKYQNPYHFKDELEIACNGNLVNLNDYVLDSNGLIGIVNKVYKNFVIAKMLTNEDIILQVSVNNCYGLLKYENEEIYVSNFDNTCQINIHDEVYTSNLGKYDEKYLIGKIYLQKGDHYYVKSSSNFNDLKYVVIVTGEK